MEELIKLVKTIAQSEGWEFFMWIVFITLFLIMFEAILSCISSFLTLLLSLFKNDKKDDNTR